MKTQSNSTRKEVTRWSWRRKIVTLLGIFQFPTACPSDTRSIKQETLKQWETVIWDTGRSVLIKRQAAPFAQVIWWPVTGPSEYPQTSNQLMIQVFWDDLTSCSASKTIQKSLKISPTQDFDSENYNK